MKETSRIVLFCLLTPLILTGFLAAMSMRALQAGWNLEQVMNHFFSD